MADPGLGQQFQDYLNTQLSALRRPSIQAARATGSALNLPGVASALPAIYGLGSLTQGDVAQGVGEIAGGVAGAKLSGGLASAAEKAVGAMGTKGRLLAPIVGGAVRLAGGLVGGGVGGGVASAAAGGAARAAEGITGALSRGQMARGESPGVVPGVGAKGIEGLGMGDIERLLQIQTQNTQALMPMYEKMRNADMGRQMQLNQQLGQLTGAINQQKYMAQLAGGAQSEAGATTRSILTAANPYAQSVFSYGG